MISFSAAYSLAHMHKDSLEATDIHELGDDEFTELWFHISEVKYVEEQLAAKLVEQLEQLRNPEDLYHRYLDRLVEESKSRLKMLTTFEAFVRKELDDRYPAPSESLD